VGSDPAHVERGSPRRLVLGGAILVVALGPGLALQDRLPHAPAVARAGAVGRPNIVLIQTDDQTYKQRTRRVMPKTNRLLVRRGTKFTDYVASTAQCCPSRASLITGQYAHNHGVTSNNVGYPGLVDKSNVLPVWLRRAGYRTIHVGKFLNGYERFVRPNSIVPPGWDQWHSVLGSREYYRYHLYVNGRVVRHGTRRRDNITRVLNGRVATLTKRYAARRRPFYLQLDARAPHDSRQRDPFGHCGREPIPEARDEGLFRNEPLPRPPSFNEQNMADKPPFISAAPKLGRVDRALVKKHWRCALASLRGVDRGVGKIYDAVKDAGELKKTVFIFVSDNGQFYGEHRLKTGKVLPYEEALRLPLLIRAPKRYRGGASRVGKVSRPVENIDLAPTILDFAAARPCSAPGHCRTMDGRSLVPLLTRSGEWPGGRGLLVEYRVADAGRYATCDFAGIRTRDDLYVRHLRVVNPATRQCVPTDQRERYDLKHDRLELHSLCPGGDRCPTGSRQAELEALLSELRNCAGIAGRDQRVDGRPFCS
jgi:N-acetylglucosamine-6-sulfatase